MENANKVLNNNTTLRVFGRNNPLREEIPPVADMNQAEIRAKQWMLSYEKDNDGIIRKNKSQQPLTKEEERQIGNLYKPTALTNVSEYNGSTKKAFENSSKQVNSVDPPVADLSNFYMQTRK